VRGVEITPEEGRVLGCLVEKQLATPQQYPLTDKALIAACNQTTSRDPVVSYDLTTVRVAVRSLREKGLVRTVHRPGERSDKHQHELPTALQLSAPQVAVLAVLLLRGPQTAAELRARTERMHPFGSLDEVEQVLTSLADGGLAERVGRLPGRREDRWAEGLVGGDVAPVGASPAPSPAGPFPPGPVDASAAPGPAQAPGPPAPIPAPDAPSVEELVAQVAVLRDEVATLRDQVATLRDQVASLRG